MIRWRVYRSGGRMRTLTKLQILAAILIGFFLGYVFLPSSLSYNDEDITSKVQGRFNAKPRPPGIQISQDGKQFVVEGKPKRILSGAIHYFRVVPSYWEDRLKKLQAAGLNTVETYVPWNAHEPSPGVFDFTGILDIHEYILTAQHLGLHVIVRPGPYICAEWEMGGLPAWLLHDPKMVLRSNYPPYTDAVKRYFIRLFQILVPLQSAYGGPIIGFQVENEYAYWTNDTSAGLSHMKFLYKLMRDLGALEVMFTSDGQYRIDKALMMKPSPDVIHTLNYQNAPDNPLVKLKAKVPHHPLMVMEFWTGWFDHWGDTHLERNIPPKKFKEEIRAILAEGASFNLYMFHGGTNFGFMNGGNWGDDNEMGEIYRPTVSSYDYDAPLSEWGSVTQKYVELRNILSEMVPESMSHYPLPPVPRAVPTAYYGDIKMTLYMSLLSTLQYVPDPHTSDMPIAMEYLPLNHGSGQAYGYVLYRTFIPASAASLTIHGLRDYGLGWNKGIVFINGANLGRYWKIGPPRTLYVPAPLLTKGINKIMIFEFSHPRSPPQTVTFGSSPILDIARDDR